MKLNEISKPPSIDDIIKFLNRQGIVAKFAEARIVHDVIEFVDGTLRGKGMRPVKINDSVLPWKLYAGKLHLDNLDLTESHLRFISDQSDSKMLRLSGCTFPPIDGNFFVNWYGSIRIDCQTNNVPSFTPEFWSFLENEEVEFELNAYEFSEIFLALESESGGGFPITVSYFNEKIGDGDTETFESIFDFQEFLVRLDDERFNRLIS